MVVDEAVAESVRAADRATLAAFGASCVERMAQLFTGFRGGDPHRAGDVDLFLEILDELWNLDLEDGVFADRVSAVESFSELQPSEEELIDVKDIYAFYAVLCMRYAVVYRVSGDSEELLRCAHASLTALGQLDSNMSGTDLLDGEREFQRRIALGAAGVDSLELIRDCDRGIGRKRLIAVNSRLRQ